MKECDNSTRKIHTEHETYRTQTKVYKILKQIRKDRKKQHVFKET